MTGPAAQPLEQIHAVLRQAGEPAASARAGPATYRLEQEMHESALLRLCPAEKWYKSSHQAGCPRPILVAEHHQQQLADLHKALATSITDIVERWWTDAEARFPQRMPLQKEEEDLLRVSEPCYHFFTGHITDTRTWQWMEAQIPHGLPQFRDVLGSWRPDFLVEEGHGSRRGSSAETYCITEINARFSFNGFLHEAFGQQALLDMGIRKHGFDGATDPVKVREADEVGLPSPFAYR